MIGRERERGTVFKLILWVCVYTNSTKVHFKSNGERYKKSMVERLYRRFFKKMRRGKKKKKNKKRETWILNLLTTAAAVNHPKSTAQWITLFLSVLLLGDLNVNFIASLKKSKVYGQWLSHQVLMMDSNRHCLCTHLSFRGCKSFTSPLLLLLSIPSPSLNQSVNFRCTGTAHTDTPSKRERKTPISITNWPIKKKKVKKEEGKKREKEKKRDKKKKTKWGEGHLLLYHRKLLLPLPDHFKPAQVVVVERVLFFLIFSLQIQPLF